MKTITRATGLNRALTDLDSYATKAIALIAKADPDIANLSFGEPEFGPPEHLLPSIEKEDWSLASFLAASKHYEEARGSLPLRVSIADWYRTRYGLNVNPETEILVTHGGVAAITLALLATTEVGDTVGISDPSYMLYSRTVKTLGRCARAIARPPGVNEYRPLVEDASRLAGTRAMIINSPENPTGYVLGHDEWDLIGEASSRTGIWVIHDEVYDVMDFGRRHRPALDVQALTGRSLLVNSFSKKFGMPGLRIGWLVGPAEVIDLAAKAHDYLYLGVNIQSETIALRLLSDTRGPAWLADRADELAKRCRDAQAQLDEAAGYRWPRKPLGAMFLFPDVTALYEGLPEGYRTAGAPPGDAVAQYLLEQRKVAVVPGSIYGQEGKNHIRLVLCTRSDHFDKALARLS